MSHPHRSPSFTLGQSGEVAYHDGSPLFVPHPCPQLGDTVVLHSEETLVVVAARGDHPPIQCTQHLTDLIGSQHHAAGASISADLVFGIWRATSRTEKRA